MPGSNPAGSRDSTSLRDSVSGRNLINAVINIECVRMSPDNAIMAQSWPSGSQIADKKNKNKNKNDNIKEPPVPHLKEGNILRWKIVLCFATLEFLLHISVIKVLLKNMPKLKKNNFKIFSVAYYCQPLVCEQLFKFSNKNIRTTPIAEAYLELFCENS